MLAQPLDLIYSRNAADAQVFDELCIELTEQINLHTLTHLREQRRWRGITRAITSQLMQQCVNVLTRCQTLQRRPGPLLAMVRAMAGPPADRGLAVFTATMLWRSPGLRSRVLPLLGVPAAMAFLALRGSDDRSSPLLATMALQFPAIYLPIVIAFLPQADQQGCRWVFDSGPELPPERTQRAVWLALVLHLLLPVQLVALTAMLIAGQSPAEVLPASGFALGSGGLAARFMVRSLDDLPFCRDREPTAGPDLGNLLTFGILLAVAGAGAALLPTTAAAALAAGTLAILAILLRQPRSAIAAQARP